MPATNNTALAWLANAPPIATKLKLMLQALMAMARESKSSMTFWTWKYSSFSIASSFSSSIG